MTYEKTYAIAAADVDRDGDLDVLLGNTGSPSRVLLNAGDGTFPTSIELPGDITYTTSIAAAASLAPRACLVSWAASARQALRYSCRATRAATRAQPTSRAAMAAYTRRRRRHYLLMLP